MLLKLTSFTPLAYPLVAAAGGGSGGGGSGGVGGSGGAAGNGGILLRFDVPAAYGSLGALFPYPSLYAAFLSPAAGGGEVQCPVGSIIVAPQR